MHDPIVFLDIKTLNKVKGFVMLDEKLLGYAINP